jgi:hypothetical protein
MAVIRSWLITIQSYFDDIPIKPLLYSDKVLLVRRLNWPKIIGKNEVLSKSEGFKL